MRAYRHTRSRSSSAPRPGRWMDLKYRGTCRGCGTSLAVGKRAFYDPADKLVCCTSIDCAGKFGITEEKWMGSPVSGSMVTVLAERRLRRPDAEWTDADYARGHSATQTWKQRHGRCEDAPCCGCCD